MGLGTGGSDSRDSSPGSAPAARATPRARLFRKHALALAPLVGILVLATGLIDLYFSYRDMSAYGR